MTSVVHRLLPIVLLAGLWAAANSVAFAQGSATSAVAGVVNDSTGAVVPGAGIAAAGRHRQYDQGLQDQRRRLQRGRANRPVLRAGQRARLHRDGERLPRLRRAELVGAGPAGHQVRHGSDQARRDHRTGQCAVPGPGVQRVQPGELHCPDERHWQLEPRWLPGDPGDRREPHGAIGVPHQLATRRQDSGAQIDGPRVPSHPK